MSKPRSGMDVRTRQWQQEAMLGVARLGPQADPENVAAALGLTVQRARKLQRRIFGRSSIRGTRQTQERPNTSDIQDAEETPPR